MSVVPDPAPASQCMQDGRQPQRAHRAREHPPRHPPPSDAKPARRYIGSPSPVAFKVTDEARQLPGSGDGRAGQRQTVAAPAMFEADAHVVDAGGGAGDVEHGMTDKRAAVADDEVVHARLAQGGAVGSRGVGEAVAAARTLVGRRALVRRSRSTPIQCGCQPSWNPRPSSRRPRTSSGASAQQPISRAPASAARATAPAVTPAGGKAIAASTDPRNSVTPSTST